MSIRLYSIRLILLQSKVDLGGTTTLGDSVGGGTGDDGVGDSAGARESIGWRGSGMDWQSRKIKKWRAGATGAMHRASKFNQYSKKCIYNTQSA